MAGNAGAAEPDRRIRPHPWLAWAWLIAAVALIVLAVVLYRKFVPHDINLVRLQWAGSPVVADSTVHGRVGSFRVGLWWDIWALLAGTSGLVLACCLGMRVFWTPRAHVWAAAGLAAAAVAGLLNAVQDGVLITALDEKFRVSLTLGVVEALSFVTFSALLLAATAGVLALATTFGRLVMHPFTYRRWNAALEINKLTGEDEKRKNRPDENQKQRCLVIPPPLIEVAADDDHRSRWWESLLGVGRPALIDAQLSRDWWTPRPGEPCVRWTQGFATPTEWERHRTGVCVSGGGIRSASVALGALQALRVEEVLSNAAYLVSVSGGGYTTGAIQLALQPPMGQSYAEAKPGNVFAAGSVEEDHLRRHSSYIADTLGQWVVALAVLFRGVLSSLVVIGLTITTLGLAIGGFYGYVPIVDGGNLVKLRPVFLVRGHPAAPPFPSVQPGVMVAIGVVAAFTILAYLAQLWALPAKGPERWLSRIAGVLTGVTALLATIGVVLPALLWASSWVTWHLGFSTGKAAVAGSLSLVTVTTFLGAIAATLWRNRTTVAKGAATVTGLSKGAVTQVLPNSMIQMIIMWICLVFLILLAVLGCCWAATSGLVDSWWALLPIGALAVIDIFVDQTSFSLHPFYRRRLASAFAVRRVRCASGDVARPYSEKEMTWLTKHACHQHGFPEVTFNATANITRQDRTPPGRRAVPFTLAHDYIGGPQTGWVCTDFLQKLTKGSHIQRDLTIEAAMAISGAAFASAMGSQTRFYEVFLALSNARLGAWLPNPYFVAMKAQQPGNWTIPGLPRKRRLGYFAREIFNIHPSTGRLLLCTDGGHYDNLGLVELLRRRCRRIYCIDASGAGPPLDDTLAGAITLAREELGVDITLTGAALELVPGGHDLLKPAHSLGALNERLSRSAVTIGKITYPDIPGHKKADGELVFAQAVLTPDMPYQLLDFPQDDVGFPRDSTADQWFNAAQFDAYQQLGYIIGQAAARAPAHLPAVGLAYLSSESSASIQAARNAISAIPPHPWRHMAAKVRARNKLRRDSAD